MSHDLMTNHGVERWIVGPGRELSSRESMCLRFARAFFNRSDRELGPRSRRTAVGVEAVEPRISLSAFTMRPTGVILGVEYPNLRSTSLVRQFDPQPDPPTVLTKIIAI